MRLCSRCQIVWIAANWGSMFTRSSPGGDAYSLYESDVQAGSYAYRNRSNSGRIESSRARRLPAAGTCDCFGLGRADGRPRTREVCEISSRWIRKPWSHPESDSLGSSKRANHRCTMNVVLVSRDVPVPQARKCTRTLRRATIEHSSCIGCNVGRKRGRDLARWWENSQDVRDAVTGCLRLADSRRLLSRWKLCARISYISSLRACNLVNSHLPILRTGVWAMSWATNWLHSITANVLLASDWSFAVVRAALTSLGLGSGFLVCPTCLGSWMPASQKVH